MRRTKIPSITIQRQRFRRVCVLISLFFIPLLCALCSACALVGMGFISFFWLKNRLENLCSWIHRKMRKRPERREIKRKKNKRFLSRVSNIHISVRQTHSLHRYTNSNGFLSILFSSSIWTNSLLHLRPSCELLSNQTVLFLRWHFSVWFRWTVFFYQHRLLDGEHVFIALSFIPFEFMFENDRDIMLMFGCVCLSMCVCVSVRKETQIHWFDHGFL